MKAESLHSTAQGTENISFTQSKFPVFDKLTDMTVYSVCYLPSSGFNANINPSIVKYWTVGHTNVWIAWNYAPEFSSNFQVHDCLRFYSSFQSPLHKNPRQHKPWTVMYWTHWGKMVAIILINKPWKCDGQSGQFVALHEKAKIFMLLQIKNRNILKKKLERKSAITINTSLPTVKTFP